MRKFSRLTFLICTLALLGGVAAAGDDQPVVTTQDNGQRAIARWGVAKDASRQSQLAVKELSFLLKRYPDATTWAVIYNTTPKLWRLLEYDIERRQLMEVSMTDSVKSNNRGIDFYPAHIHGAAQGSLNIEGLWKIKRSKNR